MKQCLVTLESVSPYSQSRPHNTEALEKEGPGDYEKRTWKKRLHVNEDGYVFIPAMAFKNCLSECAQYLGIKIPGRGKERYKKHFFSGILVTESMTLPIKADDVEGEWLFVPSQGKRGGANRVWKCFPYIPHWVGDVIFHILDDTITKEVFEYHLSQAGRFIGIGRFRPSNNGFYGRFKITGDVIFEDV